MCAQDSRRGSTRSSFTRIEARPNLRCTRRRFPARVSAHVKPWCSRVGVDWSRLTRWCLAILLPHPVSMGQSPASQAALSPLIHWLSGPRRAPGQSGDSGTPRAQTRPGNERSHAVRSAARSTAAPRCIPTGMPQPEQTFVKGAAGGRPGHGCAGFGPNQALALVEVVLRRQANAQQPGRSHAEHLGGEPE